MEDGISESELCRLANMVIHWEESDEDGWTYKGELQQGIKVYIDIKYSNWDEKPKSVCLGAWVDNVGINAMHKRNSREEFLEIARNAKKDYSAQIEETRQEGIKTIRTLLGKAD